MKQILLVIVCVVTFACIFSAGSWYGRHHTLAPTPTPGRKILYYVDPMNPAHTSDKPGKAPCGMDLEPVYADSTLALASGPEPASLPPGSIKITPEKQQLIGVRLATAEKKKLVHSLRLLGKVAIDETRTYRINAAVNGWITKTQPVTTGSQVKKDETLASFYSPEFLSAMQALLFGLNARDRTLAASAQDSSLATMQSNQLNQANLGLQQYRDTLLNLGMGNLQIDEIMRTRRYKKETDITSPADGFILARNVSEGQRFEKGTELFRIADLSHVWILVDVYERDASLVHTDQPVKVELPNQGRTFTAVVSKTLPQFDNITRTLKLRLETDNADFALKPDMFVDVELPLSLAAAIVVPAEAVLDAGLRQTVFVDRGNGYFEPRTVNLGSRVGDQVRVVQGLTEGERIVISGTFLLDSESRMKLAATGGQRQSSAPILTNSEPVTASDPVCGMKVELTDAQTARHTSEYQRKTYYFCNETCKQKFVNAPGDYVVASDLNPGVLPALTNGPAVTNSSLQGVKPPVESRRRGRMARFGTNSPTMGQPSSQPGPND
jgi:membrane fusion protein, copper/silver efflux system